MSAILEKDPKLDDVLLFNDYLLKLARVGIPIGLEMDGDENRLPEKLNNINSHFALAVARGSTIRQVLDSSQELPSTYRDALAVWLYCDHSPDAFKPLSECANGNREMRRLMEYSVLQPLVLLTLVYAGFLFLVLSLWPKMDAMSQQIHATQGWGLRFLAFAMQSIWIWTIAVPLLIAILFLIWKQQRSRWKFMWIPGRKGIAESVQKAGYAESLANLLEHRVCDSPMQNAVALQEPRGKKTSALLQWALGGDIANTERASALHASARAYRRLAESRSNKMRTILPILFGSLFGGAVVLFYGLSLFAPMIELLFSLTRP